ncbi:MAG: relaxase/mobilization nuclease domain-containing protein [Hyphomicrobiales bacterium]|nr:relaxase/mobilization nuclease domain-containing protein [Hyphomicrobiales bacterium]
MRKAGGGGGGRLAPTPAQRPAGAPSFAAAKAPTPAPGVIGRAPLAAQAGLATGSQAAVVKLASYGAGTARAASLLNYQSHKGELTLEREDGSFVTGKSAIADLAAHWREEGSREPSNDVLRFAITLEGEIEHEAVRAALSSALAGHRFAWRLDREDDETTVDLVAVAAGTARDAYGKRERIYANAKSLDALHDKIEDAFGREVSLSEAKWAHGVEGATTMLAALTKSGKAVAETDAGRSLDSDASRLFHNQPSNATRELPENFNPALQIAKAWRPAMRSTEPRDFAHVILSAKPGTDKDTFMDAARATLAREFTGHEYVFVMHTNRDHIHVHAAIRLTREDGEKLHPGIQDFNRWRQTLAEEARERRIPMEAVRRFDQAHAPAYKLKDVKMTERGQAPPSVRRRIDRVKSREIHHPTRPEGRKRATEAAAHWKSLAARRAALPPPPPGAIRLFRAESTNRQQSRAPLFSTERATAEAYSQRLGAARLMYLDVPAERIAELRPSRQQPKTVFLVPRSLSALSKPVNEIAEGAILPFQARAEAALLARTPQVPSHSTEDKTMRTAETMDTAKRGMADALSRISDVLPEGAIKDDLLRRSRDFLDKADAATTEQRRLEREPGEIEGDRFVQPEPAKLGALFTNERKGSEIHYSRHDAQSGAYQTLAFVDKGKHLDVRDWNNPESVNAALKLASDKWETVTINGSDAYKETVARLAAEHGYKITNPEMQDRIRELRAEIETQRATIAEGKTRTEAPTEAARPEPPLTQDNAAGKTEAAARAPVESMTPAINTTSAERAIELNSIRERVDREAQRETGQAGRATAAHETNAATSSEATPYRTEQEARTAREAERAVDNNPARPIPADPTQSEAIQTLRHEQTKVLKQAEQDAQRQIDRENVEKFRAEERNKDRSESEGESR